MHLVFILTKFSKLFLPNVTSQKIICEDHCKHSFFVKVTDTCKASSHKIIFLRKTFFKFTHLFIFFYEKPIFNKGSRCCFTDESNKIETVV